MTKRPADVAQSSGHTFSEILNLNTLDLEHQGELMCYRLQRDPRIFRGAMCLDAGCGRGEASFAMASLDAEVVIGIDVGSHLADARRNNAEFESVYFVCGDMLELPFPSDHFDVVHSSGVLHHLVDPEQGFRELVRVLKPGGLLYVAVVGREGLQLVVTQTMRLLGRIVPLSQMSRFLLLFLPNWAVSGLLDVGYAEIRRTYREDAVRSWFEGYEFKDLKRTPSERYDYRKFWSRLWWGVGWIQISGFKPSDEMSTILPQRPSVLSHA